MIDNEAILAEEIADYLKSKRQPWNKAELFAVVTAIAEKGEVMLVLDRMPPELVPELEEYLVWLAEDLPRGEVYSNNVDPVSLKTVLLMQAEIRARSV